MADRTRKYRENVSGRYYVDDSCIGCMLCNAIAPGVFFTNLEGPGNFVHDYVGCQPDTPELKKRVEEALEACPVQAIGDDGDDGFSH